MSKKLRNGVMIFWAIMLIPVMSVLSVMALGQKPTEGEISPYGMSYLEASSPVVIQKITATSPLTLFLPGGEEKKGVYRIDPNEGPIFQIDGPFTVSGIVSYVGENIRFTLTPHDYMGQQYDQVIFHPTPFGYLALVCVILVGCIVIWALASYVSMLILETIFPKQ